MIRKEEEKKQKKERLKNVLSRPAASPGRTYLRRGGEDLGERLEARLARIVVDRGRHVLSVVLGRDTGMEIKLPGTRPSHIPLCHVVAAGNGD